MNALRTASSVALSLAFAASCGAPAPRPLDPPASAADAGASSPRHTRLVHVPAPAPPRTTTPMAGEPAPARLEEARLEATSCEALSEKDVKAQITAMRAEMRAQYQEWHDHQPTCWAEDRERSRDYGDPGASYGHDRAADAFGAGAPMPRPVATASPAKPSAPPSAVARVAGPARGAPPAKAGHTSGTNNQVASVDEADIVKTDGSHVYIATAGAFRILTALDPKLVSVTRIGGKVRELFVEGDRAVVYASEGGAPTRCTYAYDCTYAGDGSRTTVTVLDIADPASPKVVRKVGLSGSLLAARRIGKTVHTVVSDGDRRAPRYETWPSELPMCGTPEAKVKEAFSRLEAQNIRTIRQNPGGARPTIEDLGSVRPMCDAVLRTPLADGQAQTSLVSFDLDAPGAPARTITLSSRPGAVFASADALYLAVAHPGGGSSPYAHRAGVSEVTDLHKIRLGTRAQDTRYVATGTVPGHVLNQLAMDEWHGYLRVASSVGRVPDPNVSSEVSMLAEDGKGHLVRVGAATGIAKGEDIRAVRFDDDRGYVVTFKKTDPLFVLDLARPSAPTVLGELEIPGFSTYLHRLDRDHLLSIGFDADDHGSFAYFDGVILQLFDVSSPTKPRLLHKEKIGTRGSSSEAATNHLAFNYDATTGLLAVPMTVCEGGGDGRNGDVLAFSGLLVYDVDLEGGFRRLGGVDHGTRGASCGTWWSNASSQVKRSVFVDDLVWSLAEDRAKVQRTDRLGVDVADFRWEG